MYEPVFTPPPRSWREWWSAVREFTAGWYGIAAGEVSGYHRQADRLGRHLGVSLSPSIHEWFAFAIDLQQAGIFDRAFGGDRFTVGWDESIEAMYLLTLGEKDVCWGVQQEHLADDDPPVDVWHLAGSGLRSWRWSHHHTPAISQFALQHLIHRLVPAGGVHYAFMPVSPENAGLLRGAELIRDAGLTSIDLGAEMLIEGEDLVVLAGKSPWTPPEVTDITVHAVIGPSRTGSIPPLLLDLAPGLKDASRRLPRPAR